MIEEKRKELLQMYQQWETEFKEIVVTIFVMFLPTIQAGDNVKFKKGQIAYLNEYMNDCRNIK